MLLFSDMLYMLVRYASPSGPNVLEVPDVDFIRPYGVVVLLCFIAAWTCVVVSVIMVVCSLCCVFYV